MTDISNFSLDILKEDRLQELNENFKAADAFQRLCHDLLKHNLKHDPAVKLDNLIPFPTGGADGGIDSFGYFDGQYTLIIECKKNNTLENAEEALQILENKLKKNLGLPNARNTRYAPWFHASLKKYLYCVSCSINTPNKYKEFQTKVAEMIGALSREIDELAHLKQVDVIVYPWNKLKEFLEENRFLYHKWIKFGRIKGIEPLSKYSHAQKERIKYSNYLYEEHLPYIWRHHYKQSCQGMENFKTEADILEILNDDEKIGCIIFGEGGIGKTRLMLQLGYIADEQGWIVYKIKNDLGSIEELEPFIFPAHKHLLIIDYLEENPLFSVNIIETLEEISPESTVKIIANCRNSFRSSSHFPRSDYIFYLDLNREEERSFKAHIAEEIIIQTEGVGGIKKDFYQSTPSLAVFLRFLHDKYKNKQHDRGTVDIRKEKSFRQWIERRLTLTFIKNDIEELLKEKEIFYLFPLFPSRNEVTARLLETHSYCINKMIEDGWVESGEDRDELKVIHDTLVDEILMLYLEAYEAVVDTEIIQIFHFALKNHSFSNCVRSFERIINLESLARSHKTFYDIFSWLVKDKTDQFQAAEKRALAVTTLMDDREKLTLFSENFSLEKETNIILTSWLQTGGDKYLIKDYFLSWLQKFQLDQETGLVLSLWLKAGGNKEMVKDYIKPWINEYINTAKSGNLINAWLQTRGDIGLIKDDVEKWIKLHPNKWKTGDIVGSWLLAGGEKQLGNEYIKQLIETFSFGINRIFIIRSWLLSGGDKEIVKEYIKKCLETFPERKETKFSIVTWLEAGGDKELVKKYIKPWLEKYPLDSATTSYVMKAWLKAGGEREEVEFYVKQWLEKYQESFEASYVIKAWIRATKDTEFIKTYAHNWLRVFKEHKHADFVIKRFCSSLDIPENVLEYAIYWCKKYSDNREVLYTLSYLSRYHIFNQKFASQWLIKIISHWITAENLKNHDIRNLESTIFNISKNEILCQTEECMEMLKKWFLSGNSFRRFTLHKRFNYLHTRRYFETYGQFLFQERLDFTRDEEKIQKFLKWVNKWFPENKKKIKRKLKKLRKHLPQYNHLWDIVQFESVQDPEV